MIFSHCDSGTPARQPAAPPRPRGRVPVQAPHPTWCHQGNKSLRLLEQRARKPHRKRRRVEKEDGSVFDRELESWNHSQPLPHVALQVLGKLNLNGSEAASPPVGQMKDLL